MDGTSPAALSRTSPPRPGTMLQPSNCGRSARRCVDALEEERPPSRDFRKTGGLSVVLFDLVPPSGENWSWTKY